MPHQSTRTYKGCWGRCVQPSQTASLAVPCPGPSAVVCVQLSSMRHAGKQQHLPGRAAKALVVPNRHASARRATPHRILPWTPHSGLRLRGIAGHCMLEPFKNTQMMRGSTVCFPPGSQSRFLFVSSRSVCASKSLACKSYRVELTDKQQVLRTIGSSHCPAPSCCQSVAPIHLPWA